MNSVREFRVRLAVSLLALVLVSTACSSGRPAVEPATATANPARPTSTATSATSSRAGTAAAGRPAHVVIVVEENHSFGELTDPAAAPFISSLAAHSAVFTDSFAVTHPSQPNYLALFSGSMHGVTDDSCPHSITARQLAASLLTAGLTFAGYSEGLPTAGYLGCSTGEYARKHNPWSDFTNVPASREQTADRRSPRTSLTYRRCPSSSPMNCMTCTAPVSRPGTSGCRITWAVMPHGPPPMTAFSSSPQTKTTTAPSNRILTMIAGDHVRAGRYAQRIDHYSLLRTIEDMYGLPRLGKSATAAAIAATWRD